MSFYLMHRGWMENEIFEGEPFDKRSAWAWLIENAAWDRVTIRIKQTRVVLERGELCFSERFLAVRWGWSQGSVHRFIVKLATIGMIARRRSLTWRIENRDADRNANRPQTIISICNYERYQDGQKLRESRSESRPKLRIIP